MAYIATYELYGYNYTRTITIILPRLVAKSRGLSVVHMQ